MAAFIDKERFIEEVPINKAVDTVADHLASLNTALKTVLTTVESVNSQLGGALKLNGVSAALKTTKGATEQLTLAEKEHAKILKQIEVLNARSNAEYQKLNRQKILAQQQQVAINKSIRDSTKTINNNRSSWDRLGKSIMTYATAYVSVQAVIGSAKAIFNQTKELDQLNFGMKTVIKSSVEFAQTQKFLSEVAANYGGDLLTLSQRYIKFRAAAMQSNMSALESQKIFNSVSKAAGTLGLKTDELGGVYLALEQMISKGNVTTEELRRQLGERLPGAFGIMANALGVTTPQLDKMLKKGEVLTKDALPKFAAAVEKAYGIESLKKIDTLAAAQGRLSTEITGLIKAFSAADSFKATINALAAIVGHVKDNIKFYGSLAKGLTLIGMATATYNLVLGAGLLLQKQWVLMTGKQLFVLPMLNAKLLETTMVTRAANGAVAGLSSTFKTFGGWVSILASILVTAFAGWKMVKGGAKDASIETKTFQDNMSEARSTADKLFNSLSKVSKGTYEYKDSMFQINNLYGSYIPNLLTEKSTIDEIAEARKRANQGLIDEMMLKERGRQLEEALAAKDKVIGGILADIQTKGKVSASEQGTVYNKILDIADMGVFDPVKRRELVAKAFTGDLAAINEYVTKATFALEGYKAKMSNINDFFSAGQNGKKPIFDIEQLKNAEDEFKKLDELTQANKENGTNIGLSNPVYSQEYKSFKEYLLAKLKLADDYNNAPEIREAIGLALGGEIKGGGKGNEFTKLEKLKEIHKQELDLLAKNQQEVLGSKVLSDDLIALADKDNKNELLLARLDQINKEKKLVKEGGEEFARMSSEYSDIEARIAQNKTDYILSEDKRLAKGREDQARDNSDNLMFGVEGKVNDESIRLNKEAALQIGRVKNAKDASDQIRTIEYNLSLAILKFRRQEYEAALASNILTVDNEEWYGKAIRDIDLRIAENAVDQSKQGTKESIKSDKERLRSMGDAVNEGFNSGQQIYANQAEAAKKRYDDEIKMAGDSVEGKIIAERKYEAESLKIRRKQAIADKAQAVFNIGLTLAMASAELDVFKVIAATLAIAAVLAKPIPQYAKGTKSHEGGQAIMGEQGAELVTEPSGKQWLTESKPMVYDLAKGSSVLPADKTSQMLASYAVNQGAQVFVDMSVSNRHLQTIADNTKNKSENHYDLAGRLILSKRNNTVTRYL